MDDDGVKRWGRGEFWGLGSDFDLDWILTEKQKLLRTKLIELCRTKIRPHAVVCDEQYVFPRRSLDALSELGLLGLVVPLELGGLGENHVAMVMVVETIARYGCPSTAMVYTMHLTACASLLMRYHNNSSIANLLRRMNSERLIGTAAASDPATGSHLWFSATSKVKELEGNSIKLLKFCSWVTSAGFADWYVITTVSPDNQGDYSDMSFFLVYKDEVRTNSESWKAMGLHGNQSGPALISSDIPKDRLIGAYGEGYKILSEGSMPTFYLSVSGCWNGISMGAMDLAKKHVTRKAHADVGMRICDYPTIQKYFGECVACTMSCRFHVYFTAEKVDRETDNNNCSLYQDPNYFPRGKNSILFQASKYQCSKNVNAVTDKMLRACGGTGYKTDLGLERLVRDAWAACIMGTTNEVIELSIGQQCLLGKNAEDPWEQHCNDRVLHHELNKMTLSQKKELLQSLQEDVALGESEAPFRGAHPFQDTDFDNPFNTCPPHFFGDLIKDDDDGKSLNTALRPDEWRTLTLRERTELGPSSCSFVFKFPKPTDHLGCLPGQYIEVRAFLEGRMQQRYFSPVSDPNALGQVEIAMKFLSEGAISNYFKALKPGAGVEFRGPCGGFEYRPNQLDELTILASGAGVTPGLQVVRSVVNDRRDRTKVRLLYYAESVDEMIFREELDRFAAEDPRIDVVQTLENAPEDWNGEEGLIDTNLIDKHVTKPNRQNKTSLKHKVLICGGGTMVVSCLHSLRSLKFPSEMIFIYGQLGVSQLRMVFGKNAKLCSHKCDDTF